MPSKSRLDLILKIENCLTDKYLSCLIELCLRKNGEIVDFLQNTSKKRNKWFKIKPELGEKNEYN